LQSPTHIDGPPLLSEGPLPSEVVAVVVVSTVVVGVVALDEEPEVSSRVVLPPSLSVALPPPSSIPTTGPHAHKYTNTHRIDR
jgi:hypothetical protein